MLVYICLGFIDKSKKSSRTNHVRQDAKEGRPSCPGLHDLRIACLNTYYNIKAIPLHYNITDQLSDQVMVIAICIVMIDK